jgi:DNA invertase Pin-like site-specific DNA recombinase
MTLQFTDNPVAYSYQRFSHPDQAKGNSLRRQNDLANDWAKRTKVPLDKSLTLRDKGVSAFTGEHRSNPDRHALALFLKWIEKGRVRPGDYLLIENLDRLSREEVVPAAHLLTGVLLTGVRVVQLSPSELLLTEKSDAFDIMRAVMELSRGHGESVIKSRRVGAKWAERRKNSRENGDLLTNRIPAWIEIRDGKLRLIPERAAAIRRILDLAASGYGCVSIIHRLEQEKVPAFGKLLGAADKAEHMRQRQEMGYPLDAEELAALDQPGYWWSFKAKDVSGDDERVPVWKASKWLRSYLNSILSDRRVLGEMQPCRRDGSPEGEPIKGYFPAVATEAQWSAARAGAAQRRTKPGRVGKHVNVFGGLLRNARDGDTYRVATRSDDRSPAGKTAWRILINSSSQQGHATCYSFPFAVFERALLSRLREINPREILNGEEGPDEAEILGRQLGDVEAELAEASAFMDANGFSPTIGKRVAALEARQADLNSRLTAARQKAAHPLSEAWGETKSLLEVVDTAPDQTDARLRLRACLRRVISEIWLLVVPQGRDRLAAVQVWFADGKRCRSYLILHRPPHVSGSAGKRTEGGWWPHSLTKVVKPGALDLRKRADAAKLEAVLAALDPAALAEAGDG